MKRLADLYFTRPAVTTLLVDLKLTSGRVKWFNQLTHIWKQEKFEPFFKALDLTQQDVNEYHLRSAEVLQKIQNAAQLWKAQSS